MPIDFPEADWKTLSRLKPLMLDRLCQRIMAEAGGIVSGAKQNGYYRAYLDLFAYIQSSDEAISNNFDDWKRSQALVILVNWRSENLLTEEEFANFSAETRAKVTGLLEL